MAKSKNKGVGSGRGNLNKQRNRNKQFSNIKVKGDFFKNDSTEEFDSWYQDIVHYGLTYTEALKIKEADYNPLKEAIDFRGDPARDLLRVFRDPQYFGIACKYLFNIELLPFQEVILQTLFAHPFPLLLACRGGGKTFIVGVFLMLMSVLYQGTKIIMVGVGFRQARLIFDVMEKIWNSSPVLQDIVGNYSKKNVIYKMTDRWSMYIGDSEAHAFPIGEGGKTIRGFRSNITVADEFQSQNPQVYEEVIGGFSSTAMDPVAKVMEEARRQYLIAENRWSDEQESIFKEGESPNRQIICGTADYDFGHFSKYFNRYDFATSEVFQSISPNYYVQGRPGQDQGFAQARRNGDF
jgi:hypothetical protein